MSSIGTPSITNKGDVGVKKALSPLPDTLKLEIPRTAIVPRIPGLPVLFWIFIPATFPCKRSTKFPAGISWISLPLIVTTDPVKVSRLRC
ncbi:hypothetical protein D3C87_1527830 [compost metagenome]